MHSISLGLKIDRMYFFILIFLISFCNIKSGIKLKGGEL